MTHLYTYQRKNRYITGKILYTCVAVKTGKIIRKNSPILNCVCAKNSYHTFLVELRALDNTGNIWKYDICYILIKIIHFKKLL